MAHARRPPYGAPQGPPFGDHQPSYGSSREPYVAKNGYGPGSPAAHFNGNPRRGPPQEYQNPNEPSSGSYGYEENWHDQGNPYNGGSSRYGGRGQNRGGRWAPAQRLQGRPIVAGRYHHNDPRSRGPPQSKSAAPGRGHYQQQDPYYQSNQYRQPQGYEQHYQLEEMYHNDSQEHDNGVYEYDEFSLETPDNRTPVQHYNRPQRDDQAYQDPEYSVGYLQQDRGGPYGKEVSPGSHGIDRPPRQPEAPASGFNHNQPNSTRPQNPQHAKPCKSAKA